MPIYGLVFALQEKEITKYCFGECKKIVLGAIDGGDGIGTLIPCKEADCPFLEKQMETSIGSSNIDGEPVYLRKLIEA